MITLTIANGKYIDENGNEYPLPNIHLIPQPGVVIGFDSIEERAQYIASLPKVWDKEAYCQQINEAHNALFESMYKELDYLTIGEIPIWQNDLEFGAESLALQTWWVSTCKQVSLFLETVTEQTQISPEDFINSLPKIDSQQA